MRSFMIAVPFQAGFTHQRQQDDEKRLFLYDPVLKDWTLYLHTEGQKHSTVSSSLKKGVNPKHRRDTCGHCYAPGVSVVSVETLSLYSDPVGQTRNDYNLHSLFSYFVAG